ncbi:MAG: low molecular weight phosphatase family protein [Rhodobiaceae bacterium]|nr:low molecular weight phosphatase family protein [Rhodobiaceae bacterium]
MEPGKPPQSVLFVCGLNSIRSPMAAALMKLHFPSGVYIASAGVRHGEPDGFAAAVMDEVGADIAGHQPISLEELGDTSFDLIITLAPEAHHKALEMTRTLAADVEYWPTEDPSTEHGSRDARLDAYRRVRDALETRIRRRFAWAPPATH